MICSLISLYFNISIALKLPYNQNKLLKLYTIDPEIYKLLILNFDVIDKGLGIVSPAHFVYDFSPKMFLMLHSIN